MSHQINLFDRSPNVVQSSETDLNNGAPVNGRSSFNDPAFASNKSLPIHRWVPWIAGFSSDFVGNVLRDYLPHNGTVLDPFCGVCTTLVEAALLHHNAIGFEINPYAALASRTKANAFNVSAASLQKEISRFRQFYTKNLSGNYQPRSSTPAGFRSRAPFFSPKVLHKVLIFHDFLETLKDGDLKDLFRIAFASTMVQYSNYSYEPSLGRRVSAGKEEVKDYAVENTLLSKLEAMKNDIGWVQERLSGKKPNLRVIETSFFNCREFLEPDSIDLIITSPPYLNNYHYNRNTRPQLYWLGLVNNPKDMRSLETSNFGKFWQTVREQELLELEFDLPGSDLADRLAALRRLHIERGAYGGNGWANYAAAYFNDCRKFATGINHVLKSGGRAFVVIGNSILQGIVIPTDRYFGQIAESVGLDLVRIDIPRSTRVGNSIIQSDVRVSKAKDSDQLYEAIVEVRKR